MRMQIATAEKAKIIKAENAGIDAMVGRVREDLPGRGLLKPMA